jgi:hypothetical protein
MITTAHTEQTSKCYRKYMPATWKWETAATDKWQHEIRYIEDNNTIVVRAVAIVR